MSQHIEENGRTYHAYKSGKYVMPNDKKELDRLDTQHVIFKTLFDGNLFFAPVDSIPLQNVLDVATGSGIWASEFATQHPNAAVIGTDLSLASPPNAPSNVQFSVQDAEDDWHFPHTFEYIHFRAVLACFANPKEIVGSAFKALSPGGYLELQDFVYPIQFPDPPPPDSTMVEWNEIALQAAAAGGRPMTNTPKWEGWMREVGFEDVQVRRFVLPGGSWHADEKLKRVGMLFKENCIVGLESISSRLLAKIGWSPEQIEGFVERARAELKEEKVKFFCEVLVITGRKPAM